MELKVFELRRLPSKDNGTFGVLLDEQGYPFLVTLELPWLNNLPDKSCIPAGVYIAQRVAATEHIGYPHFVVTGVSGREGVAIHKANTVNDLRGCVGIGAYYGHLSTMPAILDSGIAFDKFMSYLVGIDSFRLAIKDAA